MNKKAITLISKAIIIIQFILIVGAFSFIYFFAPHLDYPKDNALIEDNKVGFKFRNANVILIDDNPDFNSPKEINLDVDNITKVIFEPGTYYWKAIGILESSSRKFTINSNVGLELDEENSSLKNVGNVPLNVSEENETGITGLTILDVEVEYPVETKNKTIYRGEEYENER